MSKIDALFIIDVAIKTGSASWQQRTRMPKGNVKKFTTTKQNTSHIGAVKF